MALFADCLDDVTFVRAKFQFVGSNDDELSFNKRDVFVITKQDDGGWWEGTLDGKIGWFPNNYVETISADPEPLPDTMPESEITEESSQYHSLVVDNIIQTQKAHLDELKGFLEKYLDPLQSSDVLTKETRDILAGNYSEIVDFQVELDQRLEQESLKKIPEQRFGKCYLEIAQQMRKLYLEYCSNHPNAANKLSEHEEELKTFMEGIGAPSPGNMTLTFMLSKPFIHVEKYGNQIKELERHIQENHIDNLDMRKATQVLQIIALSCNEVRKKKEQEMQMLTGDIEGWKGDPISNYGNLIHMGQVFVEKEDVGRRERYFCLFPKDLLVLSVSAQLVGYCFEETFPSSVITAKNVEDTETFFNGFHITVMDKLWRVMTSSPREKDAWMHALKIVLQNKCELESCKATPVVNVRQSREIKISRNDSKRSEVKSLSAMPDDTGVDTPDFVPKDEKLPRSWSTNDKIQPPRSAGSSPVPPIDVGNKTSPAAAAISALRGSVRQPVRKEWSFTRLRPTPPSTDGRRLVKKGPKLVPEHNINGIVRKTAENTSGSALTDKQILEEDMMILSVIEAYCNISNRAQQTMGNCGSPDDPYIAPDVPPHFSFKPITPARASANKQKNIKKFNKKKPREIDATTEMGELKQQVQNLHRQTLYLRENLEEERKSRETFERVLKRVLKKVSPDIDWTEDQLPPKTTPL